MGDVYIIMKNYIYERKKGKYIHLNPSLIPKYSIHPPERKEKKEKAGGGKEKEKKEKKERKSRWEYKTKKTPSKTGSIICCRMNI